MNRLGIQIRLLQGDAEFLLQRHEHLHQPQAVDSQIVLEPLLPFRGVAPTVPPQYVVDLLFYLMMRLLIRCARSCAYEIANRADWYWSCRTRSYFMDIIRMLENQYYEYGMQTPEMQMQRRPQQEREELQKVLEYIESHLDGDLTLEAVCQHFRTYKKQVERWFQAYKGMTYYQYVKELRLKKVCFYLRFTELQMKEIAVRVGFSSAQNLARFFQKEKRMSMSAFRRQSVWERQNDRELQAIRSSHTA